MITLFVVHVFYLLAKVNWRDWRNSVFGPDSLVPNLQDAKHLMQRVLWFFGLSSPPKLERWAYWEKFGYWAVFWGIPILGSTGIMLRYPLLSSKIFPGWCLNVAALFHRAEAILAMAFIFIVHFIFGHLAPSKFPMSEVMFSGCTPLDELNEERPAWMERLQKDGGMATAMVSPSPILTSVKVWMRRPGDVWSRTSSPSRPSVRLTGRCVPISSFLIRARSSPVFW